MSEMIKQIAIVGSGMPLTMATAILASSLKPFNVKIIAIELAQYEAYSAAESCGPEFSALCNILGLQEQKIISHCNGTFRLGNQYQLPQHQFFVPYAHIGLSAEQDDFEQALFQTSAQHNGLNLNEWSSASSAALAGKFAIAGNNRPDLQKALEYGVHLDRQQYQVSVQEVCNQSHVQWINANDAALTVERDENGDITSVIVGDKQKIAAQFWIDLSSERELSANNAQVTYATATATAIAISHRCEWQQSVVNLSQPYTQLQKLKAGWLKVIPLRNRTIYQAFVDGSQGSLQSLQQELLELSVGFPVALFWQKLACHKLEEPWQGNTLALGDGALQLGGLIFTELQCLQAALVQFLDLFPDLLIGPRNRHHYNRMWQRFVIDAHDYTAAHFYADYKLTAPKATTATLQQRIALFQRLGRLEPMHSDAVTESQWYNLLFGLGIRPELPSAVISKIDAATLTNRIDHVREAIFKLVCGMPTQEQYLARFYPISSK
jgi:tryptophan halogenase